MIVTDGSYVELSKASDMNEESNNYPIFNRDIKDIQNYRKIIQILEKSKIPFIIFFMPNDLRDKIDDFLVEYAKKKNYKNITTQSENNIYISYSIKIIEEEINIFKNYICNYISTYCKGLLNLKNIAVDLYKEIIEKIIFRNIFNIELVTFKLMNYDIKNFVLESFAKTNSFVYNKIELKNDNEKNEFIKNHKKVPSDFFRILICEIQNKNNI